MNMDKTQRSSVETMTTRMISTEQKGQQEDDENLGSLITMYKTFLVRMI